MVKLKELAIEESNLTKNIISFMKFHIGMENKAKVGELMNYLFRDFDKMDIYKKNFYWQFIKLIISKLRKEEIIFIVITGNNIYVLQTIKEANSYNLHLQSLKKGLTESQKKAIKWVKNKSWQNIK